MFSFLETRNVRRNVQELLLTAVVSAIGLLSPGSICAGAQQEGAAPSVAIHGQSTLAPETPRIPEGLLARSMPLVSGTGSLHETVSTALPEAQAYYDQGLSLLYSYEWIRAARSLHESLRRDPKLAMAYLGLSYAYSGLADDQAASRMLDKARELAPNASPRERLRINLRLKQLFAMHREQDLKAQNAYEAALDEALNKFPNDVVLLLLRGNLAEGYAAGIGQRGGENSARYYRAVLKLDPMNAPAHHFLAHSYEMSGNLAEAVQEAALYAKLAPNIAHAHHIYGHELMRAGRLQEAILQFETARRLDERKFQGESDTLLYDWHYRHNLSLLAASYRLDGKSGQAGPILKKLAEMQSMNAGDEYYAAEWGSFLMQTGRYDEALTATTRLIQRGSPFAGAIGHVVAGTSFAAQQSFPQAEQELAAASAEARNLTPGWREFISSRMVLLQLQILLHSNPQVAAVRFKDYEQRICSEPGTDHWAETLFQLEFIASYARSVGAWDIAGFTAEQMKSQAAWYPGTRLAIAQALAHRGAGEDTITK